MAFSTAELEIIRAVVPMYKEQGYNYYAVINNPWAGQSYDIYAGYNLIFVFSKIKLVTEDGLNVKIDGQYGSDNQNDILFEFYLTSNGNHNTNYPASRHSGAQPFYMLQQQGIFTDTIGVPWYCFVSTNAKTLTYTSLPDYTYTGVKTYENTYYIVFFFTVFVMCWLFARVFRR